ncbi:porin [Paraburkholderia antibiotica]|uniref:Porin n=1 Tax=Paraburkholderia antibiotica TaxID=2728839 RepID=A0A7Y0A2S9_9BURK|nr:porin [Paraburkholderia antibiotica]NML35384.1 porin [Paraburkholderia antibiotica]
MKRHLAVGMLLQGVVTSIFAQSSVTLYGSIDNGLTYVNNLGGHSSVMFQSGISKDNSLGFTGVEDLGDGMTALFKIENGFSSTTGALGQGGLMFGKQAYVGLAQNSVGQITLGRQYDFTILLDPYMSCFTCGIYSVENADLDRASGERLNNSAQFRSADFKGFTFGTMYAFGQGAGALTTNAGRAISANAKYTHGPFSAIVVYTDINGAPIRAGSLGVPTVLGVPVQSSTTLTVDKQRIVAVGALYELGAWTPSVTYSNTELKLGATTATDQILRLGTTYRVRPDVLLAGQLSADRFQQARWYTINTGFHYFLSKRTDLYFDVAAQRATGPGTKASVFLTAPSSTNSQFVSHAGIKHVF